MGVDKSEKSCPLPDTTDFVISGNNNIKTTSPSLQRFASGKISLVYASSLKTNPVNQIFQSVLKSTGEVVVNTQAVNSLKSTHEVNYNHYLIPDQDSVGVTWQSETNGPSSDRIFFKIYNDMGKNITPEVTVNPSNYPSNRAEYNPTTVISTDGKKMAISWVEKNTTENYDTIKLQYFKTQNGERIMGSAVTVSQKENCYFYYLKSIQLLDQGIAIVWISKCNTKDNADVDELNLIIYDWDGKNVSGLIPIGAKQQILHSQPDLAANVHEKNFFVIWETENNNIISISGAAFNFKGSLIKSIEHVNENLNNQIENIFPIIKSIGKNENAFYVIVWNYITKSNMDHNLHGKIYNSKIQEIGSEFKVNQNIKGEQDQPTLVATGALVEKKNVLYPEFLISWSSIEHDSNLKGIFSRVFLSDSTPLSDEFKINTQIEESQYSPVMVSTPNSKTGSNDFFIAWYNVDLASNQEIFGKQLKFTKIKMNVIIEKQQIQEGDYWDFSLHDNTFNCEKQDIQVEATLKDDNKLPEWLKWDQDLWRFAGTVPYNVATYTIVLNAKDPCENILQYTFDLQVTKASKKSSFHWSLFLGILIPGLVIFAVTIASVMYLRTKKIKTGYKEIIQNQAISSNFSDTQSYSSSNQFFQIEDDKL
ncbi:hypothetical protein M0812_17377 [Anaeramoeba flamelloides]|uniref:Transmembrane protein n=1 Tax=Anaeramoeba flamelloides TaxID=1746091 RepID=A0AAV7ZCU1_9EUKA|nr:hypothetical protein M0812_17377 [Anaeramoeba flamelloides]